MPNIAPALKYFEDAFDWSDAEKTGRITPREGVNSDFDLASANIVTVKGKLEAYLKEQQEYFKSQSVRAFSHVYEIWNLPYCYLNYSPKVSAPP